MHVTIIVLSGCLVSLRCMSPSLSFLGVLPHSSRFCLVVLHLPNIDHKLVFSCMIAVFYYMSLNNLIYRIGLSRVCSNIICYYSFIEANTEMCVCSFGFEITPIAMLCPAMCPGYFGCVPCLRILPNVSTPILEHLSLPVSRCLSVAALVTP